MDEMMTPGQAVTPARWYRCRAFCRDAECELAPCDVLAQTPDLAAREYAKIAGEDGLVPHDAVVTIGIGEEEFRVRVSCRWTASIEAPQGEEPTR